VKEFRKKSSLCFHYFVTNNNNNMSKRRFLEMFFDEEAKEDKGKGKEKEDPMSEEEEESEDTLGESTGYGSDHSEEDVGPAPKEPPAKKRCVFRLCSRQLFLTYPKCEIPPVDVLRLLMEKLSIQDHIVAQEKHKVS